MSLITNYNSLTMGKLITKLRLFIINNLIKITVQDLNIANYLKNMPSYFPYDCTLNNKYLLIVIV